MDRVLYAPRELPPLLPDVAQDPAAYSGWIRSRDEQLSRRGERSHPELSLVMITAGEPATMIEQTLHSLRRQTSRRWSLTIAGPASPELGAVVRRCLPRRQRHRVRSLVAASGAPAGDLAQQGLDASVGHAVSFVFPGDVWAPSAVAMLGHAVRSEAIVYADEDRVNAAAQHFAPRLKPDYSPDFLLSSAYIGRPIAIGPEVARRLPPLVADNSLALEHELALAACEVADSVRHISEVLCHRYEPAAADSPAPIGAHQVEAALRRRGDTAQVAAGRVPGTFQILRPTTAEAVSILVPFRDEPRLLRECVDSVTATTRDNNIEFVLIDNGSSDPEVFTMLERLDTRNDVRVISDPRPFNWARLNNEGARVAQGTVLLFLNNDIEAQRDGWLSPLIAHAMRPDVGAVGGRLLYPDGRLQHCGVVVGLIGAAGHPLLGLPNEAAGYLNMALATRECSAVTGACMATRSDVFDRLNGFDETLGVDLNDIDFCLRAFAAGYRTVYEPAAELIHHESPSRGTAGGAEDIVKFVDRWRNYISAGDPYFNPHLTRTDVTCGLAGPDEGDTWDRWYSSVVA